MSIHTAKTITASSSTLKLREGFSLWQGSPKALEGRFLWVDRTAQSRRLATHFCYLSPHACSYPAARLGTLGLHGEGNIAGGRPHPTHEDGKCQSYTGINVFDRRIRRRDSNSLCLSSTTEAFSGRTR